MLDTETKRRIDTARDILVGKVSDPKSQIEQITIALIYKFMDDMDREAVEKFKGKAKFFTGEYAKYGWRKIFDPKLGGHEMLALYSEAIEKHNTNPNIPQLFRDIFKNAYLPYRDPETLKLFLKTINEFSYDHSERLGDAFEYLLSVLGTQGDAGQFRTPRHIIDFIVQCVQPQKHETIADPACGTAGFIISAYKYIVEQNTKKTRGDKLTPDDRKKMAKHFWGYDIDPNMVRLALANMYLHGFASPHIYEYDTLTSEERWNENFDVILANPPFMTPKGGVRPHKKFSVQANRSEVLFVDYIAEHINSNTGRAGVIVPEGIIFQSATAYKALRKMLVEQNYLYAVVSLPAGIFSPYSGVKTSILLMDKMLAKKANSILFLKIESDGYDLGAQRRAIAQNDLPDALQLLLQYKQALKNNTSFESDNRNVFLVEKEKIKSNVDYNLSIDRYRISENVQQSNFPIVKLSDLCEINPETRIPNDVYGEKDFIYLDITSVENGSGKYLLNNFVKGNEAPSRARRSVKNGDVLLSTVRPNLKAFAYLENLPHNIIASTGFAVLRFSEKATARYVYQLLFSEWVQNQMIAQMGKGAYPSINQTDVENLEIPLPPLSIQQQIVSKIESYQKIIEGAKQVTENYKPQIEINPSWKMVELEEVCEVKDGTHDSPAYVETGIPFITQKNITENGLSFSDIRFITESDHHKFYKRSNVAFGDILISMIGANRGMTCIVDDNRVFSIKNVGLIKPSKKVSQLYLLYYLKSADAQNYVSLMSKGGAQEFIGLTALRKFPIPLPPPKTQQEIVSRIEQEQQLVSASKQLIQIFEQKIKNEINKLWVK